MFRISTISGWIFLKYLHYLVDLVPLHDSDDGITSGRQRLGDSCVYVDQTNVRICAVGPVQNRKNRQVAGPLFVENDFGALQPTLAVGHFYHVRLNKIARVYYINCRFVPPPSSPPFVS